MVLITQKIVYILLARNIFFTTVVKSLLHAV